MLGALMETFEQQPRHSAPCNIVYSRSKEGQASQCGEEVCSFCTHCTIQDEGVAAGTVRFSASEECLGGSGPRNGAENPSHDRSHTRDLWGVGVGRERPILRGDKRETESGL